MRPNVILWAVVVALVVAAGPLAPAGVLGYWPMDEGAGGTTADVTGNHPDATISGAQWLKDTARGWTLSFDGTDDYVDAGNAVIPQMTLTNDFTWSYWVYNERTATDGDQKNAILLGNRYKPGGGDWSPREFVKATPTQFEFHRGGGGDNLNYADLPTGIWQHHAIVKDGDTLSHYLDGDLVPAETHTITQGLNNPQPLCFGGSPTGGTAEGFEGRIDEAAIWDEALSAEAIAELAKPPLLATVSVRITADNQYSLYVSGDDSTAGILLGSDNTWQDYEDYTFQVLYGEPFYLHVLGTDVGAQAGLLAQVQTSAGLYFLETGSRQLYSDTVHWMASETGWGGYVSPTNDYGSYGVSPWFTTPGPGAFDTPYPHWIWHNDIDNPVGENEVRYFTATFTVVPEPATLSLLALGGLGILARWRRRS